MLARGRVLVSPEAGESMLTLLEAHVMMKRDIAPARDGRIRILR
jgi:hypothetical protein